MILSIKSKQKTQENQKPLKVMSKYVTKSLRKINYKQASHLPLKNE